MNTVGVRLTNILQVAVAAATITLMAMTYDKLGDNIDKFKDVIGTEHMAARFADVLFVATGTEEANEGCYVVNPNFISNETLDAMNSNKTHAISEGAKDYQFKEIINKNEAFVVDAEGGPSIATCGKHGVCKTVGKSEFRYYDGVFWQEHTTANATTYKKWALGEDVPDEVDLDKIALVGMQLGSLVQRQTCECDPGYVVGKNKDGDFTCVRSRFGFTTATTTTAAAQPSENPGDGVQLSAETRDNPHWRRLHEWAKSAVDWDKDHTPSELSQIFTKAKFAEIEKMLNVGRSDVDPAVVIADKAIVGSLVAGYQRTVMLAYVREEAHMSLFLAVILLGVSSFVVGLIVFLTELDNEQVKEFFSAWGPLIHMVYSGAIWISFGAMTASFIVAMANGYFGLMYTELTSMGFDISDALDADALERVDDLEDYYKWSMFLTLASMSVHLAIAYGALTHVSTALVMKLRGVVDAGYKVLDQSVGGSKVYPVSAGANVAPLQSLVLRNVAA